MKLSPSPAWPVNRLFWLVFFLSVITSVSAQTNAVFTDEEIQGQKLARSLVGAWPQSSLTNTGVIKIRDAHHKTRQLTLTVLTTVLPEQWESEYQATDTNGVVGLKIIHRADQTDSYFYQTNAVGDDLMVTNVPVDLMIPFADSDFWLADLGLEFFHWPEQRVLKKEMRRSRSCTVLESKNPQANAKSYSRVLSWIDSESSGIVHAESYDWQGNLLKEFDPKSFKKVNGQWQLQEMEIDTVPAGSRTRLDFELSK